MMKFEHMFDCEFEGVFYWESIKTIDSRGTFNKIIPTSVSKLFNNFKLSDSFVSKSSRGVIRGMHLQIDEFAGARVVHVLNGQIDDVLIDLRENSKTKGRLISKVLDSNGLDTVFLPANIAHGFEALTESTVLYNSEKIHEPLKDTGFNPTTIGYDWASNNPIISDRDLNLPEFGLDSK